MNNAGEIIMWTGQAQIGLDELEKTGRYVVKKRYVEQKYNETAWIFQEAYQYLVSKAEILIPKPIGAESPVWIYRQANQIYGGEGIHYMKLRIPQDKYILFDSRMWNRILNLSYLGINEQEEKNFENKLRSRGIKDPLKIFSTDYYPIEKREVKKSWDKLFEKTEIDEPYLQGMIWEIQSEWVEEVI